MGILDDKVAIITGGGGGIGRGLSVALGREGARTAIVDVNGAAAAATASAVEAAGAQAIAIETDIRDAAQVDKAVQRVLDQWQRVDILVNNAQGGPHSLALEAHTDDDFRLAFESGPLGSWYFMRACFPHFKERGAGRIINFRSASEFQGLPGHGAYIAAKGAIQALTKSAAREWGKYGITVNCISPFVLHEAAMAHFANHQDEYQHLMSSLSIPRNGDAESDVGRAAVFLAGPDASFITGCTITSDGGGAFL